MTKRDCKKRYLELNKDKNNELSLINYHKHKDALKAKRKAWRKATGYNGKNGVALYRQKREEQLEMTPDDLLRSIGFKFSEDVK